MKLKSNKFDKYLVFREDFRNLKSVVDSGGAISGTPTINNGISPTAILQGVTNVNSSNVMFAASEFTLNIDLTTGSDVTSNNVFVSKWGAGVASFFLNIVSGNIDIIIATTLAGASVTARLNGAQANTRYKLSIVYKGSGATDSDRLKIYVNGIYSAFSAFVGTVPAKLTASVGNISFGGWVGNINLHLGDFVKSCSVFSQAFTPEEVLDFYQNDTYTEIDTKNAQIFLPLKSAYYQSNGVQLLVDGNMEAAGTTAWTSGSSAVLTKETTNPFSGIRVLRITGGGAVYPWARQDIMAVNRMYRVRGMCRGDGNLGIPRVSDDTAQRWIGTNSTSWQSFDVLFSPTINGNFYLTGVNTTGYCEFDDVTVEFATLQSLNKGNLDSTVTLGDGKDATFTPSLLPLNGVLMNGTSFINTNLLTDSVQANTPFTVTTYIKNFDLVPGINHGLLGTIDSVQDYRGWEVGFVNIGGARLRFLLFNAYSTNKYLSIYASINSKVNGTVTVTYDGSGVAAGVRMYQNGEQLTTTTEIDAVAGLTLSNGKPALLGGRWAGTVVDSRLRSGTQIKYPTFYNFALTPSQVRAAHKNILNLINQ